MRIQLFLIIIFVLISIQTIASKSHETDTIKKNHLLVKTEILLPILTLVDTESNTLIFGLSGEYKFNAKFTAQLSIYYLYNKDQYHESKGLMFKPEGRYYVRNHFFGIYFKYMKDKLVNYTMYNKESYDNFYALGLFYGYQWEFGNFILEGFAGAGMNKEYNPDDKYNVYQDNSIDLDLLIGIQVGWKVF